MKVKGTGSRRLLEECVKENYYARFHPHSYHCCKEMKFIPRLDINFLDSTQIVDRRTDGRTNGRKNEPLYRTLLKAGAIKICKRFDIILNRTYANLSSELRMKYRSVMECKLANKLIY